jgi:hypothetical protein
MFRKRSLNAATGTGTALEILPTFGRYLPTFGRYLDFFEPGGRRRGCSVARVEERHLMSECAVRRATLQWGAHLLRSSRLARTLSSLRAPTASL